MDIKSKFTLFIIGVFFTGAGAGRITDSTASGIFYIVVGLILAFSMGFDVKKKIAN